VIVAAINTAIEKNIPQTQPNHVGWSAMIHPPSTGAMIRVKLSIEVMAPSAPPRRFAGADWVTRLVNEGREIP
jgi:hypothetical protein